MMVVAKLLKFSIYFMNSYYTEKNNMLYLINKIVATYYKQYY